MKRIAIILTFPYFVPVAIVLGIEHLYAYVTNKAKDSAIFFGGEVPDYYIFLPWVIAIQILVGIPGSMIIGKTSSRQIAIVCAALLPFLPFVFIRTNIGIREDFLLFLGIVGLFVIGTFVSYYFLHHRKMKQEVQQDFPSNGERK